jgi:L-alanine-DL-glutamate epimerase-like enolase superfamily enzyme
VLGIEEEAKDPDLATDKLRSQNRKKVNAVLGEGGRRPTPPPIGSRKFNREGVPCGPVYSMDQVFADEQVQHLGLEMTLPHPRLGRDRTWCARRCRSRAWNARRIPTPDRGQHTDEVLAEFGFSADEIDRPARLQGDLTMKITSIRQGVVPIASDIANAYIDFSKMTASVVAITVESGDGRKATGYGFNSNGRYAQPGLLAERFVPRLEAAGELTAHADGGFDPIPAWTAMMKNEKPGGHGERSVAVGVLDMALWDAAAKLAGCRSGSCSPTATMAGPVRRLRLGLCRRRLLPPGQGHRGPGRGDEALPRHGLFHREDEDRRLARHARAGGLLLDIGRIEAVLKLLDGDGSRLCVDVNGRFGLHAALSYAAAIQGFGLRWYEEPLDPLDYSTHATLAEQYLPPIATGENLFSMVDARNLIRHGGLRPDRDILQMDPALSYGLVEYLRTLQMLREHGWSSRRCVPHGGHQFALNIAVGLGLGGNESYPEVFAPFGGFASGVPVQDSRVKMPDVPGVGLRGQERALRRAEGPLRGLNRGTAGQAPHSTEETRMRGVLASRGKLRRS